MTIKKDANWYERELKKIRWSHSIENVDTGSFYFELDGNLWAAPIHVNGITADMDLATEVEDPVFGPEWANEMLRKVRAKTANKRGENDD